MTQLKRVPEFVSGFLQQSLTEQAVIRIQTVKLLPQPEVETTAHGPPICASPKTYFRIGI
jgi:hypothetical protein